MSFQDDIQGQNTQLYPIVTIEPPDMTYWADDFYRCTLLSTNNVSLEHIHVDDTSTPQPFKSGRRHLFKPLLLNIPNIKESIDIESRKFKISNVNLDVSNIEYGGERFTDILSDTSLINWLVSIQFVSPSTQYFSTIYGVSSWIDPSGNAVSFYDAYIGNHSGFYQTPAGQPFDSQGRNDSLTQMVYQGIIRNISHDDTKVKIGLEDLAAKKTHRSLPQTSLGDGDEVPNKYKNALIPMVYGHVDRSPCVATDVSGGEDESVVKKIIIDTEILHDTITTTAQIGIHTFKVYPLNVFEESYISLNQYIDQFETAEEGKINYTISPNMNSIDILSTPETNQGFIKAWTIARNKTGLVDFQWNMDPVSDDSLLFYDQNNEFTAGGAGWSPADGIADPDRPFFGYMADSSLSSFIQIAGHQQGNGLLSGFSYIIGHIFGSTKTRAHIKLSFDIAQGFDIADTYLIMRIAATANNECAITYGTEIVDWLSYTSSNSPTEVNRNNYETGFRKQYPMRVGLHKRTLPDEDGETEPDYTTINSDFYYVGVPAIADYLGIYDYDCDIRIAEFHAWQEIGVDKLATRDFYANVKGRVNIFDDHPDIAMLPFWLFQQNYHLIKNPIDIIYDLVRSELGHDAIDEAEYAEAKAAHSGWKFGFTVNEKVNSKDLIEDIAKSTKSFPKFNNNGRFGFSTIKDSYTVEDDYNDATLIKESEVISYSFKKTKPEQIYRKVDVKYNKDYAQNSFLNKTNTIDLGADDYYGIESSSEAYLEFESNYIRDKDTADLLAEFLLQQYKNDHLIFKLKLPLQYIDLEIGDLVKFQELLNDVKAYGIDYRILETPNEQSYYPLFIVTSISKNLDSVTVECMQLHHLGDAQSIPSGWENITFLDDDPIYLPEEVDVVINGCTDPDASNYNPSATEGNPEAISSCEYIVPGCTDPEAENYNPLANEDDGSCVFTEEEVIEGCTNPLAENYDANANLDDGSCVYAEEEVEEEVEDVVEEEVGIDTSVQGFPLELRVTVVGRDDYHEWSSEGGADNEHLTTGNSQLSIDYKNTVLAGYLGQFMNPATWSSDLDSFAVGYFTIDSGLPTNSPDIGIPNIIRIIHNYISEEDHPQYIYPAGFDYLTYPNKFMITFMQEMDWDGDGIPNTQTTNDGEIIRALAPFLDWEINEGDVELNQVLDLVLTPLSDLIVIDPTLLGDVNLDGAINVLDIVSTVNYVMGNIDLEEQGAGNADMNQDGIVDVLDIVSLVDEVMNQ